MSTVGIIAFRIGHLNHNRPSRTFLGNIKTMQVRIRPAHRVLYCRIQIKKGVGFLHYNTPPYFGRAAAERYFKLKSDFSRIHSRFYSITKILHYPFCDKTAILGSMAVLHQIGFQEISNRAFFNALPSKVLRSSMTSSLIPASSMLTTSTLMSASIARISFLFPSLRVAETKF